MAYTATQIGGEWCYATAAEVLAFCHLGDITLPLESQTLLERIIQAKSRSIDETCRRVFFGETGAEKVYSGNDRATLTVDDVLSVSSVTVDGEAWVLGTDFKLAPFQRKHGFPYTALVALEGRIWESEPGGIGIVGNWGWSSVPHEIHLACLNRVRTAWAARDHDPNLKTLSTGDVRVELAEPRTVSDREFLQVAKYVRPIWRG
jgi:hypothetical protein